MTSAGRNNDERRDEPLADEHDPPGERQGEHATFSVDQVARAFRVDRDRVVRAVEGEFRLGEDGLVDSRQATHLADALLADRIQDEREAALMELGAYTPRRDTIAPSVSEKAPGEIDDTRLAPDSHRNGEY